MRCRTDIWSSVVVKTKSGGYKVEDGFHFNNLTYLPSPRASWKGNPLGQTTKEFTSAGRRWKTECDTAQTGRGGCRSWIWTDYVAQKGSKYVTQQGWVFNNMVRFAEGGQKHVTKVPADALDTAKLDFDGIGAVRFDVSFADLGKLGLVKWVATDVCVPAWQADTPLVSRQIDPSTGGATAKPWYVAVTNPNIATVDGAKPGMTVGEIKALYGSRFQVVQKTNYAVKQYFGSVRGGDKELLFRVEGPLVPSGGREFAPTVPLRDSDVVVEITARTFNTDVSFDGC